MKIKIITIQHRRDFTAIIKCEGCGGEEVLCSGYDDRNYHDNILPSMKCRVCNKSRNDLGIAAEKTRTKYEDWQTV